MQQMDGIINQQQHSTTTSRSNGSPDYAADFHTNHSIIAAAQNLAFLLQQQQSSSPTGAISNAFPDSGTMETISHWLDNQLPVSQFLHLTRKIIQSLVQNRKNDGCVLKMRIYTSDVLRV